MCESLDGCDDDTREAIMAHVTRCSPQWILCKFSTCPYHVHSASEPVIEKSAHKTNKKRKSAKAKDTPDLLQPLAKYLQKPPKGMRIRNRDLSSMLHLIYEMFERKIKDDEFDVATGVPAEEYSSFSEFMSSYLVQKYGLPFLADQHLFGIVEVVKHTADHSRRLHWFAEMVGLVEAGSYTPRFAAFVLHILRKAFPRFHAALWKGHREGHLYVLLTTVLAAVDEVFPVDPPDIQFDVLRLTRGLFDSLVSELKSTAVPHSEALVRMEALNAIAPEAELHTGIVDATAALLHPKSAGSSPHFRPFDVVIDVDKMVQICIDYWRMQSKHNNVALTELFVRFCNSGYERMSFALFSQVVAALAPRKKYSSKQLAALFQQLNDLAGEGAEGTISPEIFLCFCKLNGFVAPVPAE